MGNLSRVAPVKPQLPVARDARLIKRTVSGLPGDDSVQSACEVFQALGNPTRIRIMHALAHDEMSVGDLARALGLSMSALSHQLAILRLLRLVAAREEGRTTFYRVVDRFVGDLVHDCLAHVEQGGGARPGHQHPHKGRR
jgi:DNA-binding transcriptional ArsR family regulator